MKHMEPLTPADRERAGSASIAKRRAILEAVKEHGFVHPKDFAYFYELASRALDLEEGGTPICTMKERAEKAEKWEKIWQENSGKNWSSLQKAEAALVISKEHTERWKKNYETIASNSGKFEAIAQKALAAEEE